MEKEVKVSNKRSLERPDGTGADIWRGYRSELGSRAETALSNILTSQFGNKLAADQ